MAASVCLYVCWNKPCPRVLLHPRQLELAHGRRQAAGDPDAPPATHDMVAAVRLRLDVRVPPPLDAVPGPLLGSAGGLVLKLLLQARPVVGFENRREKCSVWCQ